MLKYFVLETNNYIDDAHDHIPYDDHEHIITFDIIKETDEGCEFLAECPKKDIANVIVKLLN